MPVGEKLATGQQRCYVTNSEYSVNDCVIILTGLSDRAARERAAKLREIKMEEISFTELPF